MRSAILECADDASLIRSKPYHESPPCYRFFVTATVLSTAHLPIDLAPLLSGYRYRSLQEGAYAREDLEEHIAEAVGLISLLSVRVDAKLMDAAPNLKVIANYAVGYDNVDIAAATERGIVVANTPDVLTEATADFAFSLMAAAMRRLGEGERLVRSGSWKGWSPTLLLGQPIFGQALGVVGAGRIGVAMLRRGKGFGMSLRYSGRSRSAEAEALGAQYCELEELLTQSDAVSLHCPLNDGTRALIDREALGKMKATAVLVNTARGGCVDAEALAEALRSKQIAAAGLDVFDDEPAVPECLLACDTAVLAPHLGSSTREARTAMARICADAVKAVLAGNRAPTALNPEVCQ